ncbi:MAG TPA: YdcF family protein [Bryobacteraceae bacterium]|jgi:uncharacterized SAM-binding protein YcdF (DUF218 family)|nr:YdcF family protein [Bryobacteraceae bacterium]
MYNQASKLLGNLADPLTLIILLVLCALLLWKRRRLALWLLISSIGLLLIFTSTFASKRLIRSLEDQYPDHGLDVSQAQAIVVLGGTIQMPSPMHHLTHLTEPSDRLLTAFRLYRAGKAPLIFCTGGNNPIAGHANETPEATWMARLLEEWDIPPSAIQIETGSINTHENAIGSYQILSARGIRRILLVTSAIHMPRAAGAFRKAGFEVIPAPADFHSGWGEGTTIEKWLPTANNLVKSDAALHEWLGIGIYRLRGWM